MARAKHIEADSLRLGTDLSLSPVRLCLEGGRPRPPTTRRARTRALQPDIIRDTFMNNAG